MDSSATPSLLRRLWRWGCSLKLAIYVASTATLLIMGGSLIMHRYPRVFGNLDQVLLGEWLERAWSQAPGLVWWLPLSGLLLALFALNTLCCLLDWLARVRSRWRKSGEYLIHAGFILLALAFAWNTFDGFRSGPHRLFPGERLELRDMPGYSLRLERFTPELSDTGRPLDMRNLVSLWEGDRLVKRAEIRFNHPLTHRGLVVLPTSMGQSLQGFRFHLPGEGLLNLMPGSRLPLAGGGYLEVLALLPDARRTGSGGALPGGDRLGNPAMQVRLSGPAGARWEGWYFLRASPPPALTAVNLFLRPVEPLFRNYSLLTVNRDPGSRLAAAGALCMTFGVGFAFVSFYAKRARGDRPEY